MIWLVCGLSSGTELPVSRETLSSAKAIADGIRLRLIEGETLVLDLDSDQKMDRVAARVAGDAFRAELYLSDRKETLLLHSRLRSPFVRLSVSDIDNDSDNDLVVHEFGAAGPMTVWLGDGRGNFTLTEYFLSALPTRPETKSSNDGNAAALSLPSIQHFSGQAASKCGFHIAGGPDALYSPPLSGWNSILLSTLDSRGPPSLSPL